MQACEPVRCQGMPDVARGLRLSPRGPRALPRLHRLSRPPLHLVANPSTRQRGGSKPSGGIAIGRKGCWTPHHAPQIESRPACRTSETGTRQDRFRTFTWRKARRTKSKGNPASVAKAMLADRRALPGRLREIPWFNPVACEVLKLPSGANQLKAGSPNLCRGTMCNAAVCVGTTPDTPSRRGRARRPRPPAPSSPLAQRRASVLRNRAPGW